MNALQMLSVEKDKSILQREKSRHDFIGAFDKQTHAKETRKRKRQEI